jgi:purine-nucleoside phosphorylase
MYAYTGFYKNKRITIMAHGMGCPSVGIYSYELFKFYDVNTIIRIGSCGSYVKQAPVGSVIVCKEAYSESNYAKELGIKVPKNKILKASINTLNTYIKIANKLKLNILVGKIFSSDCFYSDMT